VLRRGEARINFAHAADNGREKLRTAMDCLQQCGKMQKNCGKILKNCGHARMKNR
jgi:hypothetical protein